LPLIRNQQVVGSMMEWTALSRMTRATMIASKQQVDTAALVTRSAEAITRQCLQIGCVNLVSTESGFPTKMQEQIA
jgi:hypothetical protein